MKSQSILPLLLLPLAGLAADPGDALEPIDSDPAWRISAGFRAAPGVKASATVDGRAAAALAPPAPGGARSVSLKRTTASTTTGTTEDDARSKLSPGYTGKRYEFDGGYIDPDDGAGIEGETQNWHIDDASALQDGVIVLESQPFDSRTTTKSTSTRTVSETAVERSFDETLRDSSRETAAGFELRLDRTLWEDEEFGVDAGLGYAWYDDIDCFSVAGRACTERRTVSRTTETTEFTGLSSDSGTVSWTLSAPEFADVDGIRNADGSIGGGYVVGGDLPDGYKIPVLTVTPDRFSTATKKNPSLVGASLVTDRSSSKSTSVHTVDVRSEGTLSLQELRLGARPFWKAARWLSVRGDIGLLATYSEIESETSVSVVGTPAATIRRDDDDWTFGGYAGLAVDFAATDELTLSLGAEARFPHKRLHFGDGVVSGSVELAGWSVSAGLGWRF